MALTRFVNGIVDPAQQSAFARPISIIASEVGLPLWFVELRHASTHNDLPSLATLRLAAGKALEWLRDRYWLPQQHASRSTSEVEQEGPSRDAQIFAHLRRDAVDLVHRYKLLRKVVVRDASKDEMGESTKLIKALEKISASPDGLGIEAVVSALLELGAMVPLSPVKRCQALKLGLPTELREIWRPLLDHLLERTPSFLTVFIYQSLDLLCFAHDSVERTHATTTAAWLLALLTQANDADARETVVRLALLHPALLEALSADDAKLAATLRPLMPFVKEQDLPYTASGDVDALEAKLAEMEQRWAPKLQAQPEPTVMQVDEPAPSLSDEPWPLMPIELWRPCPIGSLPDGRVVQLDLM